MFIFTLGKKKLTSSQAFEFHFIMITMLQTALHPPISLS
jgi:hypothetical protein